MSGICFTINGMKGTRYNLDETRLTVSWNYWNGVMDVYSTIAYVYIYHDKAIKNEWRKEKVGGKAISLHISDLQLKKKNLQSSAGEKMQTWGTSKGYSNTACDMKLNRCTLWLAILLQGTYANWGDYQTNRKTRIPNHIHHDLKWRPKMTPMSIRVKENMINSRRVLCTENNSICLYL